MKTALHPILKVLVREDGAVFLNGKNNRWKPHWSFGYRNDEGYFKIRINKKTYAMHRIVAETFIPNPESKPTVDHIDRNPGNNNVENLRWATHHEQSINSANHLNRDVRITVSQRENPSLYRREYYKFNREKVRKYQREKKKKKRRAA